MQFLLLLPTKIHFRLYSARVEYVCLNAMFAQHKALQVVSSDDDNDDNKVYSLTYDFSQSQSEISKTKTRTNTTPATTNKTSK